MNFFSTSNIMVHIPLGIGGYNLSWIEAVGALSGLLCIWYASKEKTINYLFGVINVSLFAVIFFQIQLYASLLLQVFFFAANIYGWYAWRKKSDDNQVGLNVRWLSLRQTLFWGAVAMSGILLMRVYIDTVFSALTRASIHIMTALGLSVTMPVLEPDAFPLWDSAVTVLSIIAMILMTRKYVENWLLWLIINLISVVIFAAQGVYAMSLEYLILIAIALNGSYGWIKTARKNGSHPLKL